jgi:hypothetical protein
VKELAIGEHSVINGVEVECAGEGAGNTGIWRGAFSGLSRLDLVYGARWSCGIFNKVHFIAVKKESPNER